MKNITKFLLVFVLIFIISILIQSNFNYSMATYNTYTDYYIGDVILNWNNNGYFVVDGVSDDSLYNITIPEEYGLYPVKEIDSSAFFANQNIVSINIPNSIEKIGKWAFYDCNALESVTIPSSVKAIGPAAFGSCENLSTVNLNEGLENIGAEAFMGAEKLRIIIIPSSVQFIGLDAFDIGYGYKNITIYGAKNSVAETFANKYDYITFIDKDMPFQDVSADSWYYNAVKYVFANRIMTGFTDTEFGPESKLTRAMFITILYKKEGSPYASPVNQFVDLYNGAYYCSAVTWGVNNNIISGYDSTHFGPDDLITREQIAVILQKYCKYKGQDASSTGDLTKFSDYNKVSNYAIYGMKWAVGKNVITGSNGKLLPQGEATRAEAAAMIQKYCYNFK